MAMTHERFSALVQQLSERAERHPTLYRLQVVALVALGYLYVGGLVVLAMACAVIVAAICLFKPVLLVKLAKVIWMPVVFAWTILRALWIRFDPPQGRELKRADAPALFEALDRLQEQMGAPVAHTVLLTDEFNAGVVQVPRLGILGWPRNYLMIGLPMMAALSPAQFRAVLAHEFGHLCAGDSRVSGRIYQQRILWARLQMAFEQRGSWAFKPFLSRFAPYFNAYSFVLARAQEYAADRASAQVAGARAAGEALVLTNVADAYQAEQVWNPLWKRTRQEEQPSQLPYTTLLGSAAPVHGWSEAPVKLRQALEREPSWDDTHPNLRDRLKALDTTPDLPPAGEASAAEVMLGPGARALAAEMDEVWKLRVANAWRESYRESLVQREQLAALEQALTQSPLDQDKAWQHAWLTEQVREEPKVSLPAYRAFNERFPDDARGQFAFGRLLLDAGDEAGLKYLDAAMAQDGEAIKPGAQLAYGFLAQSKRKDEAKRYEDAWHARNSLEQMAAEERAEFKPTDDYEPHGLPDANVVLMRDALRKLTFVKKASLVKKRVRYLVHRPVFLLFLHKGTFSRVREADAVAQVQRALNLGDNVTVAFYTGDFAELWKRVKAVPGGQLLPA
jgi:Zn-dependent protease with chaperone function